MPENNDTDPVALDPSEPDLTHRNKILIGAILDRSGSMRNIAADTIGGFNQFLADQKKVPAGAEMTVVLFDDLYEVPVPIMDIQSVPELTGETFVPRGWTALLDAIGKTIGTIREHIAKTPEADRPSKVVIMIMTDGVENHSKEFNLQKIQDLISELRKEGWDFLFLGANLDAVSVGASMGIAKDQSLTFGATGGGVTKGLFAASREMAVMRSAPRGAVRQMSFSAQDRADQAVEGVAPPPPADPPTT